MIVDDEDISYYEQIMIFIITKHNKTEKLYQDVLAAIQTISPTPEKLALIKSIRVLGPGWGYLIWIINPDRANNQSLGQFQQFSSINQKYSIN